MKDTIKNILNILLIIGIVGAVAAAIVANAIYDSNYKQKKKDLYNDIIAHESEYTIYLNGEKQDSETFKIETLNKANYTFELDMENKTIIINQKVPRPRRIVVPVPVLR